MSTIQLVTLRVALKNGSGSQSFTFFLARSMPRIFLHLSSGRLALLHIRYLVTGEDLASEDLLNGLLVLRHLKIDTKTLSEAKQEAFDGADCALLEDQTKQNAATSAVSCLHG